MVRVTSVPYLSQSAIKMSLVHVSLLGLLVGFAMYEMLASAFVRSKDKHVNQRWFTSRGYTGICFVDRQLTRGITAFVVLWLVGLSAYHMGASKLCVQILGVIPSIVPNYGVYNRYTTPVRWLWLLGTYVFKFLHYFGFDIYLQVLFTLFVLYVWRLAYTTMDGRLVRYHDWFYPKGVSASEPEWEKCPSMGCDVYKVVYTPFVGAKPVITMARLKGLHMQYDGSTLPEYTPLTYLHATAAQCPPPGLEPHPVEKTFTRDASGDGAEPVKHVPSEAPVAESFSYGNYNSEEGVFPSSTIAFFAPRPNIPGVPAWPRDYACIGGSERWKNTDPKALHSGEGLVLVTHLGLTLSDWASKGRLHEVLVGHPTKLRGTAPRPITELFKGGATFHSVESEIRSGRMTPFVDWKNKKVIDILNQNKLPEDTYHLYDLCFWSPAWEWSKTGAAAHINPEAEFTPGAQLELPFPVNTDSGFHFQMGKGQVQLENLNQRIAMCGRVNTSMPSTPGTSGFFSYSVGDKPRVATLQHGGWDQGKVNREQIEYAGFSTPATVVLQAFRKHIGLSGLPFYKRFKEPDSITRLNELLESNEKAAELLKSLGKTSSDLSDQDMYTLGVPEVIELAAAESLKVHVPAKVYKAAWYQVQKMTAKRRRKGEPISSEAMKILCYAKALERMGEYDPEIAALAEKAWDDAHDLYGGYQKDDGFNEWHGSDASSEQEWSDLGSVRDAECLDLLKRTPVNLFGRLFGFYSETPITSVLPHIGIQDAEESDAEEAVSVAAASVATGTSSLLGRIGRAIEVLENDLEVGPPPLSSAEESDSDCEESDDEDIEVDQETEESLHQGRVRSLFSDVCSLEADERSKFIEQLNTHFESMSSHIAESDHRLVQSMASLQTLSADTATSALPNAHSYRVSSEFTDSGASTEVLRNGSEYQSTHRMEVPAPSDSRNCKTIRSFESLKCRETFARTEGDGLIAHPDLIIDQEMLDAFDDMFEKAVDLRVKESYVHELVRDFLAKFGKIKGSLGKTKTFIKHLAQGHILKRGARDPNVKTPISGEYARYCGRSLNSAFSKDKASPPLEFNRWLEKWGLWEEPEEATEAAFDSDGEVLPEARAPGRAVGNFPPQGPNSERASFNSQLSAKQVRTSDYTGDCVQALADGFPVYNFESNALMSEVMADIYKTIDPTRGAAWSRAYSTQARKLLYKGDFVSSRGCYNRLIARVLLNLVTDIDYVSDCTPECLFEMGLVVPEEIFGKFEIHKNPKLDAERYRQIWNSAVDADLTMRYFHHRQNKLELAMFQAGLTHSQHFPTFGSCCGMGHDDDSSEHMVKLFKAFLAGLGHNGVDADAKAWDFNVTRQLWATDGWRRGYIAVAGGFAECFADGCIMQSYVASAHMVVIGKEVYEVSKAGIMPSGIPSTSASNSWMRQMLHAQGYWTAHKILALSMTMGDDLKGRNVVTPEVRAVWAQLGANIPEGDGHLVPVGAPVSFTSHLYYLDYLERRGMGEIATPCVFNNDQKLLLRLAAGTATGTKLSLDQVSGVRFAVRHNVPLKARVEDFVSHEYPEFAQVVSDVCDFFSIT